MDKILVKLISQSLKKYRFLAFLNNRTWVIEVNFSNICTIKRNFFNNIFVNTNVSSESSKSSFQKYKFNQSDDYNFINFFINKIISAFVNIETGENLSIELYSLSTNKKYFDQNIVDAVIICWEILNWLKLINSSYRLFYKLNKISPGFLISVYYKKTLICFESYNFPLTKKDFIKYFSLFGAPSLNLVGKKNSIKNIVIPYKDIEKINLFEFFLSWCDNLKIDKKNLTKMEIFKKQFINNIIFKDIVNEKDNNSYSISNLGDSKLYYSVFLKLLLTEKSLNINIGSKKIEYIFDIDIKKKFIRRNSYNNRLLSYLFSRNYPKSLKIRVLESSKYEDSTVVDLLNNHFNNNDINDNKILFKHFALISNENGKQIYVPNPHLNTLICSNANIKFYTLRNYFVRISLNNHKLLNSNLFITKI